MMLFARIQSKVRTRKEVNGMNRKNRQKGQGLLEYLLIVAVVVVAVVGFAAAYQAGTQTLESAMTSNINTATGATSTP